MGFASTWLEERALFPELINEAPDKQTGIIVVVPAYNEPGLTRLLDSLLICEKPECKVELIIVINAPLSASEEYKGNNLLTIANIESWKNNHKDCFFRLFAIVAETSSKHWGVGMARKTGMDEAVRRFNSFDKPDGVILALDADCQVEKNYLVSVSTDLLKRKERSACSIYFEHPLVGSDFPEKIYKSITQYELHLRYYYQGLVYSGFPYVFHTVGSAIAVKALPYIKSGGMNRRQAGEDFYFIQKLVPAGGYFYLNSTIVYPSPRQSFRVPFGTGASIEKLTKQNDTVLSTYNMQSFNELREYFAMIDSYFVCKPSDLNNYFNLLPTGIKGFSDKVEWIEKLTEIKNNTSSPDSFKKRFFGWFNMFKIVKYLNFVHMELFEKKPVVISVLTLLDYLGINLSAEDPIELLRYLRKMEKAQRIN